MILSIARSCCYSFSDWRQTTQTCFCSLNSWFKAILPTYFLQENWQLSRGVVSGTIRKELIRYNFIGLTCSPCTSVIFITCAFSQNNTFQAVLATDGNNSYVTFLFNNLEWSNGTNAFADLLQVWYTRHWHCEIMLCAQVETLFLIANTLVKFFTCDVLVMHYYTCEISPYFKTNYDNCVCS